MSLHFRYKLVAVPFAVWPLGGRHVRPRPLVAVTVIGPTDARVRLAHVDPGSDDTVFSEALAVQIGLDLSSAPQGRGSVVGSQKIALRYAEVTLRLTDGREQREWPARVGFTPVPLSYPLLGFAGFLQFFDGLFRGGHEDFELTVNRLYPGK